MVGCREAEPNLKDYVWAFGIKCVDHETERLEPIANPFGAKMLPMSQE